MHLLPVTLAPALKPSRMPRSPSLTRAPLQPLPSRNPIKKPSSPLHRPETTQFDPPPRSSSTSSFSPSAARGFISRRRSLIGRCFRCLDRSHRVSHCREPVRCLRCFKFGHFARNCMQRLPMAVYRAMRARPAYLNAFIPLTDDFLARQNTRRNAILVDVLPPSNLGHFPQETIANGMASRFGGFPTDLLFSRRVVMKLFLN